MAIKYATDGGYQNVIANGDYSYRQLGADGIPGGSAATHTVRSGDSLQSIATTYFGSPAYWYLIADANGLTGSEPLTEGMTLTIPNVAANSVNNNDTYKIYNENEIIGSTSPEVHTIPKKKKWWQKLLMVLIVIIVIVAAIFTAGAALGAMGFVTAAGSLGAIGAAGATFGLAAVGGVALGATAAGLAAATLIGAGIGLATGIVTQGLSVLGGLQESFSWKAVGDMTKNFAFSAFAAGATAWASGASVATTVNGVTTTTTTTALGSTSQALIRVGLEVGKQLIQNHGKISSYVGIALAGIGTDVKEVSNYKGELSEVGGYLKSAAGFVDKLDSYRAVATVGLGIIEKNLRGDAANTMDWVSFASASINGITGNRGDILVDGRGQMNWQNIVMTVAGTAVIADRIGEDAALNYVGSQIGNGIVAYDKDKVVMDAERHAKYGLEGLGVKFGKTPSEANNDSSYSLFGKGYKLNAMGAGSTAAPGTGEVNAQAAGINGQQDTSGTQITAPGSYANTSAVAPALAPVANVAGNTGSAAGDPNSPLFVGPPAPNNADTPPPATEGDGTSNAPPPRRLVSATVGKGQGPLQAFMDAGMKYEQAKAAYGFALASGQVELVKAADGSYVPSVKPGDELTADLDDTRFTKLAGRAISGESGYRDYVAAKKQYEAEQKAVQEQKVAQQRQADYVASSDQGGFVRGNTAGVRATETAAQNSSAAANTAETQDASYYGKRFLSGVWGAVKGVTVEPVLQVRDMGAGVLSVGYNEIFRGKDEAYWLPEMKSGLAEASAQGTSQVKLIAQAIPILNVGVMSYDATTAIKEGRYGDAAEMGGGVVGGFGVGKVAQKYGGYGVTLGDINATGPMASQRGVVKLELVTPETAPNVGGAGTIVEVNPAIDLRFTQRSAGGNGRADQWRQRFDEGNQGPPIEVVRTPDGLVTVDHTRAAVAVEKGVTNLKAKVYEASDLLPKEMTDIKRFGDATTWGEAAAYRAGNQKPALPPTGTTNVPTLPKPRG